MACALASWLGESAVLVDVGWHGRDLGGVDVSATVGWFVSQAPLRLALRPGISVADATRLIAERRAEQPDRGAGFGLLRYLGPDDVRRSLAQRPRAEVSFNHLGTVDRPSRTGELAVAEVPRGTVSGRAQRPHLLEVGSTIRRSRCHVTWTYNRTVHQRTTVDRLAAAQMAAIRRFSSAIEDR
jgi:non-ribosomal peptide synthase protein (TIGR01720 family)